MTPLVVAFLGISGVGKSTFLKRAAETLAFQHMSAGSLIGRARDAQVAHDRLRLEDMAKNQRLLVRGFHMAKNAHASIVILDGHAVIDGPGGIAAIDPEVFRRLGVGAIAHLEADPWQILANRDGDASRIRPSRSAEELGEHQKLSLATSQAIAVMLRVPLARFGYGETTRFRSFVQRNRRNAGQSQVR